MNNSAFGKTMENLRKYRDITLITTKRRRNYLALEPNCHTTKCNRNEKDLNNYE